MHVPLTADRQESDSEIVVPSYVPTRVYFGNGSMDLFEDVLADEVAELRPRRILLLTGRRQADKAWQSIADRATADYDPVIVENVVSNPNIRSVGAIVESVRSEPVDLIVALGGGSVLDTAKALAVMLHENRPLADVLASAERITDAVPVIAIPTTSGSGSEVSETATVWDDEAKIKYSLVGSALSPRASIVDPELTATLPGHSVAGTGLDALAHAIESTWSVNASTESIEYGLSAVRLLAENLRALVRDREDPVRRERIGLASLMAGLSIAKAKTTIAHAVSYPLTMHWDIHHGHACGMSLAALLRFNGAISESDCQHPNGLDHVDGIMRRLLGAFGADDATDGAEAIHTLIRDIGLTTFDQHPEFDLDIIAADAKRYDRFGNNPRAMSEIQLVDFLASLRRPG